MNVIAAVLPKDQSQYTPYTADVRTSEITGNSVVNGSPDEGGTSQKLADGEYVYTFGTKAPSGFDPSATHTIGAFGSRLAATETLTRATPLILTGLAAIFPG